MSDILINGTIEFKILVQASQDAHIMLSTVDEWSSKKAVQFEISTFSGDPNIFGYFNLFHFCCAHSIGWFEE